ncbi:hypothetical protein SASPL_136718 [Salvia splendens]|uniref:Uncharacterized protein n=1 Tax=Salvia splendens TaxID=180675 RepID=A0A8X8X0F1_SALSN|nr:putative UPF0496 protein 5 [Salvia splendens]KAG6404470.1 hypothetical protein SASPL_136718 [Salvia splendens]
MTSYADLMAREFVMAFRDLQKDSTNHEKLASFVRRHYVNRLNGPEFVSALTNKPGNDHFIVHNFFNDLSCHYKEHLVMLTTLKSMDESLVKRIDSIDVSKKVSAVFFTLAAMFFTAAAAIAAANANSKREAATGKIAAGPAVAAAAAAASILFGAVGRWIHSLLNKRETAAGKHKEIIAVMTIGAKFGMGDLSSIHNVARMLEFQNKSMSEKVDDGNDKVAAVKRGFEELVAKVEAYSDRMKWARDGALESIIKYLG